MTWVWVAPVSTAAVGLGGLVVTFLVTNTNRRTQLDLLSAQRSHHEADSLRAERKAAYLKLLAAISDAKRALGKGSGPTDELARDLEAQLQVAFDEVAITAPDWVMKYASISHTRTLLWMATKVQPEPEAGEDAHVKLVVSRYSLLSAMKADITGEGAAAAEAHIQAFEQSWEENLETLQASASRQQREI